MSWLRFLHSQSFEQSLILQPSQAASLRQRREGSGRGRGRDEQADTGMGNRNRRDVAKVAKLKHFAITFGLTN